MYKRFILIACFLLSGCTIGPRTSFVPEQEVLGCKDIWFNAHNENIKGIDYLYYVVPLLVYPWNNEDEHLTLSLYFGSKLGPVGLTKEELYVRDVSKGQVLLPLSLRRTSNLAVDDGIYTLYSAEFGVKNQDLEAFELGFTRTFHGCTIPELRYTRRKSNWLGNFDEP